MTVKKIFLTLDFFLSLVINRYMLKKSDPHSSAQAVIAFLIVALAFVILFAFYRYRDAIVVSGNLYPFIFLAFIGSSLLLALLFLVNQPLSGKTKSRKKR